MKISYGSNSKTVLTELGPGRGFWSSRTSMEKYLIMLISTLFALTIGLVMAAAIMSYNRQITFVFLTSEENSTTGSQTQGPSERYSTVGRPTTDSLVTTTDGFGIRKNTVIPDQNSSSGLYAAVYKSDTLDGQELSSGPKQELFADEVCQTDACKAAGKMIKESMNESVNPCDDFYEFACGGWEATHTIPADKSRWSSFDAVDENLKTSIKEELSRPSKSTDAKSVVFAADYYKSCIDEATIDSRGVAPLASALDSIGGWPLIGNDSSKYDWKEEWSSQVVELGIASIFAVAVQPDANDTLVNRVYLDAPNFGLGRNQLVNRSGYPEIVSAYKKYILESAVLLGAKNESTTQKQIEELLDFESQLANLSLPQEKKRDSSVWYNRMSFEKLNELTAKRVDWLNLINGVYSKLKSSVKVTSDELVIVQDIDYFKGVTQLLEKTPKEVVANYIGWNAVMGLGSFTSKKFRDVVFEFNKVVSGVEKQQEVWRTCINTLSNVLEYPVSRLYVDKNFSEKDKQEAAAMINDIKESYDELIRESDWLDDITKNKSLIKLNAIRQNIGFPEWMLTNKDLDNYYNLTKTVDPKKAFEAMIYMQQNSVFREFKQIREAVNLTTSWPMPPAIVNAAYEPTQNSITIPAGILKVPFFDSKRPAYLNYGGIGLVVGHEMTHGFDDEGSQFDAKGDLINWWTDEIHKRFESKADCFIEEYSAIIDPEAKMHLNGNNTVGENIADNGGLRESFRAYQSYKKKGGQTPRLPYVEKYTPEQLFFLSHGNVWCGLYRPEALKMQIQYNPHSPGKYRVNVPVSNFASFAEAYNCPVGSAMNPKDRCILW